MSKPKIAICVSGQTRGFNDRCDRFYENIDHIFQDFDYDLFGHTWDDQEIDQSHYNIFNEIIKTPQEEIWKEIQNINPFAFFLLTDQIIASNEYKLAIAGQGNLADLMNETITGCYAQLVSGHQAISLAPSDEYHAYVKYRWDISKSLDTIDLSEWHKDFYEWVINNNNRNAILEQYDIPSVEVKLFYDMMITFSTEAQKLIKKRRWNNMLDDMLINPKHPRLIPASAHELWENFCKHLESEVSIMSAQTCFGFAYDPPTMLTHKTNKKWGL